MLADTLWILWLYTRATLRLAESAEEQVGIMKQTFLKELVGELTKSKPIVFTDQVEDGYEIRNVGNAFAANVWYLVPGQDPTPVGALGKGESQRLRLNRQIAICWSPSPGRSVTESGHPQ